MASFPYIVNGTLFDIDGSTTLANVKVTVRNERTNKTLSQNTNSSGEYGFDLANLENGYSDGDVITLFTLYTNYEDTETHVVVQANGGVALNLTLVEVPASDTLRYFTVQDFYDFHHLLVGGENTPLTKEVVNVGTMVEEEIDEVCSTRFSDGAIELSVNDCDATANWSGSTDATAIAVSTDDADYRTKTGALDLGKDGTTEAFFNYSNSSVTSRDFRNKYLVLWVKIDSKTGLRAVDNGSALQIRYGSNSSNYYQKTFYENELTPGWNLLWFKRDDREVTEVGAVDAAAMDYFLIRFDTVATSTVFTTGTIVLDNIFVVHEEHFKDEYLDTRQKWQWDYYMSHLPTDRLIRFRVNRADEGNVPVWDEVTVAANEINFDSETGRVRLIDLSSTDASFENIFPTPGARQVNATYLFGKTKVPKDIKKLAILMTAKDLGGGTTSRNLMLGRETAPRDAYTVFDRQIDRILTRYRNLDMLNV